MLNGRCSVSPPLQGQSVENKARARQVACARDHLRRVPAMAFHNPHRIAAVLDRILRTHFLHDGRLGNTLRLGGSSHHFRLNKVIWLHSSAQNESWRNSPLVLTHALGHTGLQSRRGIPIHVHRGPQYDDRVKVVTGRIGRRRQMAGNCRPSKQSRNNHA